MAFFGKIFKTDNSDNKPEPTPKKSKVYKYIKKPTGEKELFLEIWSERLHICEVCNHGITSAEPSNFAHCLPKAKNKYPEFKLNKENIILMCECCHFNFDFKRHKILDDPKFKWVFELEESLKIRYKELHG